MLPRELKRKRKRVETTRDFALLKILLLIIGLVLLISNLGCSYHWYSYVFDPQDINLEKYDLRFFVHRATFSESRWEYVPTMEAEPDTAFVLIIQHKFSDLGDVDKFDLIFRNVYIQIDSNPNYIELVSKKEYKARKPEFHNEIEYNAFKYSGPVPKKMNVKLDAIIVEKKTNRVVDSSSIQATAYHVKRSKSILRDFLDGD